MRMENRLTRKMIIRRVVLVGALVAMVAAPLAATAHSRPRPSHDASWEKYVVAPTSRDVKPVRVLSSTAGVTNPRGGLGEGTATLNRPMPADKASLARRHVCHGVLLSRAELR